MPKVSIIIRAKNEERWITSCLKAIEQQSLKDHEVLLVDNASTDKTVAKAVPFGVRVIPYSNSPYRPGHAINVGVRASRGDFFVCLSAHCIPTDPTWLENLLRNFDDPEVAGVYGRQEPMSQTSPKDKRDLLITFGLDRRVQVKDSFFHNANSMIRRSTWNELPFDEQVPNIEDRVWGQQIVGKGLKLVYEPEASVYHYHGIHQNGNEERLEGVVRVMESIDLGTQQDEQLLKDMNIVAIIPMKGESLTLCGKPLWAYTLERALKSQLIRKVIVATDNAEVAAEAKKAGAEVPFLRPASLSGDTVGIEAVLQHTLKELEGAGTLPDLLVTLNVQFPFRKPDLLDNLIRLHFEKGFDTVFTGVPTFRSCWVESVQGVKRIDQGFQSHEVKKPVHVGYVGLGCVTFPQFVRRGQLLGDNVGILEVLDTYSTIEVKDAESLELATKLFPDWWQSQSSQSKLTSQEAVRV